MEMSSTLDFGIPNASADYIPEGVNVILQAENGALRFGGDTNKRKLYESGKLWWKPITLLPEHLCLTFKRRLPLFVEVTLTLILGALGS